MRRLPLIFFLVFMSLAVFVAPVYSQEEATSSDEVFDFQKAYKDYVFMYDLYKKSHSDYLLARSQYQEAKTLAAQTKARDAAVAMLQARDDVVITYLTALRMRLSESEGIADPDREGLYNRLDGQIAWYKDHKDSIPSAGTLDDLVKDSDEAKDHFSTTEPLSYEVLATVPVGKVEVLREKLNNILVEIKIKVEEIRSKGDHDTSITERWILETENKITRSLDKEIEAQKLIVELQTPSDKYKTQSREKTYNNVIALLQESNQFLREASSYMREIVKSIKTKS